MPPSAPLRDFAGFLAFTFGRWREDRCPQVAASLTFTTLLALVPLLTVIVSLLSLLPVFEPLMTQVRNFVLLNLVPESAGRIVTEHLAEFTEAAGRLTAISLAALFAMSIAMLFSVDRAFNAIWRSTRRRPLWLSVLGYLVLLALGPLLIGASLSATTWLVAASLDRVALSSRAEAIILRGVPFATATLAFFIAYRFFPNRRVPWHHALGGGFLAAVAFELAKQLFGQWIRLVPTYHLVYGAFATIPIFLLWMYVAWLVVLFGAAFTAALAYRRDGLWREPATPARRLRRAIDAVEALASAWPRPTPLAALRGTIAAPQDEVEDFLWRLEGRGLAGETRRGWVLKKPLSAITLGEVYHASRPDAVALSPADWAESSAELGRLAAAMEQALESPLSVLLPAHNSPLAAGTERQSSGQ